MAFLPFVDEFRSIYISIPFIQVNLLCCLQPYMAEDTATSIPTRVFPFVDSLDHHGHQTVMACLTMRRVSQYLIKIDDKRHIAVNIHSGLYAIYPHFRLIIDTVEADVHLVLGEVGIQFSAAIDRQFKGLAVPTRTAHSLTCISITKVKTREWTDLYIRPTSNSLTTIGRNEGRLHTKIVRDC